MAQAKIGQIIQFEHVATGIELTGIVVNVHERTVVVDVSHDANFRGDKMQLRQLVKHDKYKVIDESQSNSSLKVMSAKQFRKQNRDATKGCSELKKDVLNGLTVELFKEHINAGMTNEGIKAKYKIPTATYSRWKKDNNLVGYKPDVVIKPAPVEVEPKVEPQIEQAIQTIEETATEHSVKVDTVNASTSRIDELQKELDATKEEIAQLAAAKREERHEYDCDYQELEEQLRLNKSLVAHLENDYKQLHEKMVQTQKLLQLAKDERNDYKVIANDALKRLGELEDATKPLRKENEQLYARIDFYEEQIKTFRKWEALMLSRLSTALQNEAVQ